MFKHNICFVSHYQKPNTKEETPLVISSCKGKNINFNPLSLLFQNKKTTGNYISVQLVFIKDVTINQRIAKKVC